MSREFEVVVTEGMEDEVERASKYWLAAAAEHCNGGPMPEKYMPEMIKAALAHPSFRAQLRAWAAEEMQGLVPDGIPEPRTHAAPATIGHNECRAETLANIEKWEKEQQP